MECALKHTSDASFVWTPTLWKRGSFVQIVSVKKGGYGISEFYIDSSLHVFSMKKKLFCLNETGR